MRKVATSGRRRSVARRGVFGAAMAAMFLLAGCGLAGNPQPPTLWLPTPVKDLTAARVNDGVHLHWSMPKNTTDRVALKGDQRGHVCWEYADEAKKHDASSPSAGSRSGSRNNAVGALSCHAAGDGMFTPGKPADFTARLPEELMSGEPRAVAFYVELQNHAGKTAGPSNAAWIASGTTPGVVAGLKVETRAEGVVLRWQPSTAGPGLMMRIHRTLVNTPVATKTDQSKGLPPPAEQTLEVDVSPSDPGGAVDRDAVLDHEWKYWVERVVKVNVDGHALEVAGAPSETVSLVAKDVFPPAVPAGVAVVADAQAKAMDLSWTPDADADIAGYVVYRRDVTAGGAMERITEKTVVAPSYTDATVVAGHRYAYAVSAVDSDGNESERSSEVEEEMPQ